MSTCSHSSISDWGSGWRGAIAIARIISRLIWNPGVDRDKDMAVAHAAHRLDCAVAARGEAELVTAGDFPVGIGPGILGVGLVGHLGLLRPDDYFGTAPSHRRCRFRF